MGKVLVNEKVLGAALRYALPRCSTMPSIVIDTVKDNMNFISDETKEIMLEDISKAFKEGEISSHSIDQSMWADLMTSLKESLENSVPLYAPKKDINYDCPTCGKLHPVSYGLIKKDDGSFEESDLLGFISCCGSTWLVTVQGKNIRKKINK